MSFNSSTQMWHSGLITTTTSTILWPHINVTMYVILLCSIIILQPGFPVPSATATATATATASKQQGGNETDRLALVAFKAKITDDPLRIMSSWNGSVHFCKWHGVTCGGRHRQRVTSLDLQSHKLAGSISPHIANLSFLRALMLQNNSFTHVIPPEIFHLQRLEILRLNNNSISGQIPSNISGCANLIALRLSYNMLVGRIPPELGMLSKLQIFSVVANNLTGGIPPFGNFSSFQQFFASDNNLVGSIPDALCQSPNLTVISVTDNRLSGTIPPSLLNHSSIIAIAVGNNQIQGSLPSDFGIALPNLEFLSIFDNQFTGSIPASISNATNLASLIAGGNKFTGKMPTLEKLHRLERLSIAFNSLGSDDLSSFISSLTNATSLELLEMNQNNFGGMLPKSISNLSTQLVDLSLSYNQISGNIPTQISNLVNLEELYMAGNQFTGNIPPEIGKLQKLQQLAFLENKFSGNIPSSFGNLTLLTKLSLRANNLYGRIPSSLEKCQNLALLDLGQNNLSGTIPRQVLGLSSLSLLLDLSQNHLTGSIPMEVGNLINIGYLDVSENILSGEIPVTLGSCVRLETLYLQGNFLQGSIPSSLSSLRGIQFLDLSRNNLSGEIPKYLEGFVFLQKLNLSINDFEGEVPSQGIFKNGSATSVLGNRKLCGGALELQLPRSCNFFKGSKKWRLTFTLKLVISLSSGVSGATFVFCFLYHCWFRKKRQSPSSGSPENLLLKVSYQSLLKATNGFSSANLIGVGSFGSVYKGVLNQNGMVTAVAVKVLNLLRQGAFKSFMAECEALRNIRHRNLVKVLTACSSVDYQGNDFMALVYEFMANGNLDQWLHPAPGEYEQYEEPKNLSLLHRLNIAIDVASVLDYLHHHCQTPIIHCDLKPSNILLNNEMTAHVGDFGLARFHFDANSSSNS